MALDSSRATQIKLDESVQPMLLVVVDTEEEFDWSAPFSRDARATTNLREQHHSQEVLDRHKAVPLYLMDHPVTSDSWATGWLSETLADGRCEIGTHLHTWVNPPFDEEVNDANSYGCNLDPQLERDKIEMLTDAIEQGIGKRPVHFRTGRYGLCDSTLKAIHSLGYRCDLSLAPHSSFTRDGGPKFYGWGNNPYWYSGLDGLLCLPVTTGFSGIASGIGPKFAPILDAKLARKLRIPGAMAKLGLLDRSRLTIEGVPTDSLKRLMGSLIGSGERLLTLSYHSATLLPGATSYVRSEMERDELMASLNETLAHFTEALGGRIVSVTEAESVIRKA